MYNFDVDCVVQFHVSKQIKSENKVYKGKKEC